MQNNSKINTILLLVIIAMLGFGLWKLYTPKDIVPVPPIKDDIISLVENLKKVSDPKIKACPEKKIINNMPIIITPGEEYKIPSREYYVYKNARYEISEFDSSWVKSNCSVEEQIVY